MHRLSIIQLGRRKRLSFSGQLLPSDCQTLPLVISNVFQAMSLQQNGLDSASIEIFGERKVYVHSAAVIYSHNTGKQIYNVVSIAAGGNGSRLMPCGNDRPGIALRSNAQIDADD